MTNNYNIKEQKSKVKEKGKLPFVVLLLVMLLTSNVIFADEVLTIGTGNETGKHIPMEPYYCFTYSQSVYLQSEINATGPGYIDAIEFQYNGCYAWTDEIKVYVGHTTGTYFQTWKSLSSMTQVYSGEYSVGSTAGWYKIQFDEPFFYNNSDNLVFAVDENTGTYHSSCSDFYTTDYSSYKSIFFYDDYYNPDPANPPTGTLTDNRPNIKIHMNDELYTCPANACTGDNVQISGKLKLDGEAIFNDKLLLTPVNEGGDIIRIFNAWNELKAREELFIDAPGGVNISTAGDFGLQINSKIIADEVGIGTYEPSEKLEVWRGNVSIKAKEDLPGLLTIKPGGDGCWWNFGSTCHGSKLMIATGNKSDDDDSATWLDNELYMTVLAGSGNVGIGTGSPVTKLEVAGDIKATGGTIEADGFKVGDWVIDSPPDYVFDKGHYLMPLGELKKYLDKNKHLPDVPSGKKIREEGFDLVKMNMVLLKKIEELHLYAISQQNEIELLKNEVEELKR